MYNPRTEKRLARENLKLAKKNIGLIKGEVRYKIQLAEQSEDDANLSFAYFGERLGIHKINNKEYVESAEGYMKAAKLRLETGQVKKAVNDYEGAFLGYYSAAKYLTKNREKNYKKEYDEKVEDIEKAESSTSSSEYKEDLRKSLNEIKSEYDRYYNKNELRAKEKECLRQAERLEKVLKGKWKGLRGVVEEGSEKTARIAVATASIIGLLGGIFFLSSNLTGNVVGNMTNSTSNWIGGILFAIGLVGAFFYFKKR